MEHLEPLHGSKYIHVDTDRGILIAWNGNATFNVFDIGDSGELMNPDCFTRDYSVNSYGPGPEVPFHLAVDWARRCIDNWYRDNVDGFNVDVSRFSRELCTGLLTDIGIDVQDDEPIDVLRNAVEANLRDGAIDPGELPDGIDIL